MAVLRNDTTRITIVVPKDFAEELKEHLKNFALTSKGKWLIAAAKEKMIQEKLMLEEMQQEDN